MFNRVLLSLLLALVLALPAAAQDYQVRANRGLNLREGSSLQSRVVDTVRGGAILQVVGSFNRWLKIDRNGRTVWLADWTDHSRVTGASPAAQPVQPSQPIDNCCFVDRQCASADQWTAGYWAFQRGQCPTPQAESSQPVTNDVHPTSAIRPAPYLPVSIVDWSRVNEPGVDNCCQIGWDCINGTEWQRGYDVYHASQCHHSAVSVEGNANFKLLMETAFEQLRVKQPRWYSFAVSGLSRVRMIPQDLGSGVDVISRTFSYSFYPYLEWNQLHVNDRAGELVHETCHVHMYNRGESRSGWENEEPCLVVQILAGEGIGHEGFQNTFQRELLANIQDPAYWWWD